MAFASGLIASNTIYDFAKLAVIVGRYNGGHDYAYGRNDNADRVSGQHHI